MRRLSGRGLSKSIRMMGFSTWRRGGRLRLSRGGGGDQAALVVEADAGYSQEGRGLSRFTDPADGASYVMAVCYPDCGPEVFCCFDQPDLTATFRFAVRVPDGWECVANDHDPTGRNRRGDTGRTAPAAYRHRALRPGRRRPAAPPQPDARGARRGADRGGRADLSGRGGAQRPGPLLHADP